MKINIDKDRIKKILIEWEGSLKYTDVLKFIASIIIFQIVRANMIYTLELDTFGTLVLVNFSIILCYLVYKIAKTSEFMTYMFIFINGITTIFGSIENDLTYVLSVIYVIYYVTLRIIGIVLNRKKKGDKK